MHRLLLTSLVLHLTLAPVTAGAIRPPVTIRTLPAPADALDAASLGGDLHVAYLIGAKVFHAVQRAGRGTFDAPTVLPCTIELGPWGGVVRIVAAGTRLLVLAPTKDGFFLLTSDDAGKSWTSRTSHSLTGHEAVESQRLAATGNVVHLAWIDEHAAKSAGDAVAKPLYLATSTDGGRTFGPRHAITAGFPSACPCCVPSLAAAGEAVYVAYRPSAQNVKEVAVLTSQDSGKTFQFKQISDDRWAYLGCPANGPALAASGNQVSVSWTHDKIIQQAQSIDAGRTFNKPNAIGTGRFHLAAPTPRGTVSVVDTASGAVFRQGTGGGLALGTPLSKAAALVTLPDGVVLVRGTAVAPAAKRHAVKAR